MYPTYDFIVWNYLSYSEIKGFGADDKRRFVYIIRILQKLGI